MPSPYEAVLLGLAAWRVWHLLANDTLFDRPRRYVTGLGWGWQEDDPVPTGYRERLAEFLECPYCLGWHLSLVVYLFWVWLPTETIYVCIPFALNVGVIALQRVLSSD